MKKCLFLLTIVLSMFILSCGYNTTSPTIVYLSEINFPVSDAKITYSNITFDAIKVVKGYVSDEIECSSSDSSIDIEALGEAISTTLLNKYKSEPDVFSPSTIDYSQTTVEVIDPNPNNSDKIDATKTTAKITLKTFIGYVFQNLTDTYSITVKLESSGEDFVPTSN